MYLQLSNLLFVELIDLLVESYNSPEMPYEAGNLLYSFISNLKLLFNYLDILKTLLLYSLVKFPLLY